MKKAPRLLSGLGAKIANEILMSIRAGRKHGGEVSLDEPIGTDSDGNEITVGDVIGTDEDTVTETAFKKLRSEQVRDAVDRCLSGRERTVIILRYGLDGGDPLPQREVGRLLGISRSYVSRIETKAVRSLEKEIIY